MQPLAGVHPYLPSARRAPPQAAQAQVARPDLIGRILATPGIRLVLIQAAAGFGKTTLMTQLHERWQRDGMPVGWLTLDSADNDAGRLLAGLSAAVPMTAPPAASPATSAASTSTSAAVAVTTADPAGPGLLALLDRVAEGTTAFVLFLDDVEVLQESSALAVLQALLTALPRGACLVIGTRSLPALPLARLRAHGQLLEVDSDALRFSHLETAELLARRSGRPAPAATVAKLLTKTEGWAAAVWLASEHMASSNDAGHRFLEHFSGSHRAIADYLAEDVFARQPAHVRDFLLRSSVLRHLQAPLCRALVAREDVAGILDLLARQNLFIAPLPGTPSTWRYHKLFADFLRDRLRKTLPDEVGRLHRLASAWYEAQGRPVPAIEHAIESGDHRLALTLMQSVAQTLLESGRMHLLARWFEAMPEAALHQRPALLPIAVWATVFTRGALAAQAQSTRLGLGTSLEPGVRAHTLAQGPLILAMRDRYDDARALGIESLAALPSGNDFADGVLLNAMGQVFAVTGETERARQLIDRAREATVGSSFNRMYAETVEGMIDLQHGRLRQATARFHDAVRSLNGTGHALVSGNAWAGLAYARVLYESDDFEAAERLLDVYLPIARDVGLPGHMGVGHVIRGRMAFFRGEVAHSFETLVELEYLARERRLPRIVTIARLERSRLLLLQGDGEGAREELDRAEDPVLQERLQRQRLPANETDYPLLARMRWMIHFGEARDALPLLQQEIDLAEQQHRQRRLMNLRALRSLALQRTGDPAGATQEMATVVRLASREGFLRLIADEGPAVGQVVQGLLLMQQQMPVNRSDPALLAYLQRLLDACGTLPAPAASGAPTTLVEPLTRKEIQVLQLLSEGLSNADLSGRLRASDSTVRTHLRNINLKLAARNRVEAVAHGRRLGLIR